MHGPQAGFDLILPADPVKAIILVLHGGKPESNAPSRPWHLSSIRMRPFTRALARLGRSRGVAVAQLRYRVRGWNGGSQSPVTDSVWALQELKAQFGPLPVVVLAHSMGARAAAHVAVRPEVVGVVGLAPWWPDQDGRAFRPGQKLLVLHGISDRWTDPAESRRQVGVASANGAEARWLPMPGGHFMLRRPWRWQQKAARRAISWADPSPHGSASNDGKGVGLT